jgi:hypothetical protein
MFFCKRDKCYVPEELRKTKKKTYESDLRKSGVTVRVGKGENPFHDFFSRNVWQRKNTQVS